MSAPKHFPWLLTVLFAGEAQPRISVRFLTVTGASSWVISSACRVVVRHALATDDARARWVEQWERTMLASIRDGLTIWNRAGAEWEVPGTDITFKLAYEHE